MGYTTNGNFSLSRGTGHALGIVSLKGYVDLMRLSEGGSEMGRNRALVHVRNRDGLICRFAELQVV